MSYSIFVSYPNGAKSHKLRTTKRRLVESQLENILSEPEILSLADRVVIQFGGHDILNVPASTPPEVVIKTVRWPAPGCRIKVEKPMVTSLYMPKAFHDWLVEQGGGKASRGLRVLVEKADIPELKNAWRQ
ncbi:hypothetical protein QVI64_004149 [Salmonella enterica]|uniref:Uncharacterized protein n=2 Tax=Salmonella enterica TaxID=28901 RepID=A0A3W0AZY7_SALDE|nr:MULTISPECIES: hypothetical protein [Enterobacteriaceae]EAA4079258.1 hypothetical protein [Salmonella enterica subsp. enterica]EBT5201783.1 hypothetical protein [Salmonella enterica subsp. enterica serovar 4,[5],12:i:-]EDA7990097.1 hypothetical protein [Salmonella enterica subsp. enterica serovar Enteritidis]EDI2475662.1 hypothetical protein [Salmonella enterica subsp. enterica serovar Heidelberg]EDM1413683.1 hypothetical protein [Salmonella enterica subsp. enterica serovar Stanley]MBS22943